MKRHDFLPIWKIQVFTLHVFNYAPHPLPGQAAKKAWKELSSLSAKALSAH